MVLSCEMKPSTMLLRRVFSVQVEEAIGEGEGWRKHGFMW